MKFMNGVGRLFGVGLLGLGALVTACGSDDKARKLSLLDSDEPIDEGAEAERIRKMQMVRVLNVETGEVDEWTLQEFSTRGPLAYCHTPYGCKSAGNACASAACGMEDFYCMGEFWAAMAGVTPGGIEFRYPLGQTRRRTVEQSAATKAAAARYAFNYFATSLKGAADFLRGSSFEYGFNYLLPNSTQTGTCSVSSAAATEILKMAGAFFVDSYHQGRTALDAAVEYTLAVADAELASSPSFELARRRAISKSALSRSAAAHLLVGGPPGFMGSTTDAFCTSGKLSGPGKAALDVFRQAGPSPADLLATNINIEALVNGTGSGTMPASGDLKTRMGEIWGNPITQSLESALGLELSDFEEARAQLRDEIEIFNRSKGAKLPKVPGPGGTLPDKDRYAGTSSPPPERDASYWTALALSEPEGTTVVNNVGWYELGSVTSAPNFPDAPTFLTEFVDYAHSYAGWLLHQSNLRSGNATFIQNAQTYVLDPLALLTSGNERPAKLFDCRRPGQHSFRLVGYAPNDGVALVVGEDQLECATTGTIEGAPCTLVKAVGSEIGSPGLTKIDGTATPHQYGFSDAALLTVPFTDPGIQDYEEEATLFQFGERHYLIQPREGVVDPGPGDYKAILGFPLYRESTIKGVTYCRGFPIVPEAFERTKRILMPSREWCGSSAVTCAGTKIDARVPLEDELSGDGDGVESSWKHYLALAKQAADEADLLGKEYLDSSFKDDYRSEEISLRRIAQQEKAVGALEELQQVCGTAIDPLKLLEALGVDSNGTFNLSETDIGTCVSESTPPFGHECRGGRLIKTWIANLGDDPAYADLKNCVSSLNQQKTIHLGDTDLCVNSATGDIKMARSCDECADGFTCVPKTNGIGLFKTETIFAPSPPADLCDTVQTIRKNLNDTSSAAQAARTAAVAELIGHEGKPFQNVKVRQMAAGLNIQLEYNGYVTVAVGGKTYSNKPGTGWPCGIPPVGEGACADGLFCNWHACGSVESRAAIGERLYRAALAGMLISTGATDSKPFVEVPVYVSRYVMPLDFEKGVASVNGLDINTAFNGRWRLFDLTQSSIPEEDEARKAHTVGMTPGFFWDGLGTNEEPYFGFERVQLSRERVPDLVDAFWGGLVSDGTQPGYFAKVLGGTPHDHALPVNSNGAPIRGVQFLPADLGVTISAGLYNKDCLPSTGRCQFTREMREKIATAQFARSRFSPGDSDAYILPTFPETSRLDLGERLVTSIAFDRQTLLDAFELMCEGRATVEEGCNLSQPPSITSIDGLEDMGRYLECLGDDINRKIAASRFVLPAEVATALSTAGEGRQATGGAMAVAVSELRKALIDIAIAAPGIGGNIRRFGQDVKAFKARLARLDVSSEMVDLNTLSQTLNQLTNCYTAMLSMTTIDPVRASGAGATAAVTCANSVAQIHIAGKLNGLQQTDIDLQRQEAFAEFSARSLDYSTTLQSDQARVSQALENIQTQLEIIEGIRGQAKRAVDKAVWFMSAQASNQGEISSALANVKEGSKLRYENALTNAKRMAFLAKRAIELRLGMSLAEMTEDLTLVAAPSTWESTACTLTGINYDSLKEEGGGLNFADGFIGDYVDKLEQVIESYRLMHNFRDAKDVAVISLRDDILNVRNDCEVESRNLLYFASDLRGSGPESEAEEASIVGWGRSGCAADPSVPMGSDTEGALPLEDCITITDHSTAPHINARLGQRPLKGYTVRFGATGGTCPVGTCGWTAAAALEQKLTLQPGRYRFSWYTLDSDIANGGVAGFAKHEDGAVVQKIEEGSGFVAGTNGDWNRVYFTFDVNEPEVVTVGFARSAPGTVTLAAPMLELLRDPLWVSSRPEPAPFMDTSASRMVMLQVCEDTGGEKFREQKWDRQCVRLCNDGYASDCSKNAPLACYWQTSFHLSQRAIEAGWMLNQSGFARGNFNYRIDSVAVNFVGTGLRGCGEPGQTSACYAGGFLPYSLIHEGPYFVRNHRGEDYRAALFTGNIEHARGLATERYVTNPLSDTDKSLLGDYMRTELQGRPLDGEFLLRVWDEPGVEFHRIEDIQLILNYRYWTRFN